MGVPLGWKQVAPQFPYVNGQVWNDGISRSGNKVTFSFNLSLVVPTTNGYWNYAWYVDIKCGSVEVKNKKVKNAVNRNDKIAGIEYWYSTFNGNFNGSITVDGKAQTIPVTVTFHDGADNLGTPQTWDVSIPTASSMGVIKSLVRGLTPESATISANVNSSGSYSTITKWVLSYGQNDYDENVLEKGVSDLNVEWNLSGLNSATYYMYKVQVWNSAGYSETYTGSFRTGDSEIGRLIKEDEPVKILTGWIVRPSGQVQRIKEARKVVG